MSLLPKFVKKDWGYEYWFQNVNEFKNLPLDESMITKQETVNYCGKLLYVEYGKWSSNFKYHYHKIKDESFLVLEGELQLDYIDENDNPKTIFLKPLEVFRVRSEMKHRFTSVTETGCKFIEVSTFHSDDDSYRCYRDDKTGEWIEV